jgi:predicted dithiol-disulfide oxidoreductase (DUF899 family)
MTSEYFSGILSGSRSVAAVGTARCRTFRSACRKPKSNGFIIRHFWGGEMNGASADPGEDSGGAPDLMPIWTILDVTPEGRGTGWYPKLDY